MIPLIRNALQHEEESRRELAEFIVSSARLSMGEQCREFEREFAAFQGSCHAVLFNSGGSANLALLQSLMNIGVLKRRSLVGFSALTWATNVMPIIQLGMIPAPVDVDIRYLNCMPWNVGPMGPAIDMFFATNALGFAGDLRMVSGLIEDNCEALGTVAYGKLTGTFGLASTFSFFVAHHLSTIEGGMVCTDNGRLADELRMVRANGWRRDIEPECGFDEKYAFHSLGYNLRPTEVTGFLGRQQLKYLPASIAARQSNYLRLEQAAMRNPELMLIRRDHIETLSSFAFPMICQPGLRQKYIDRFVAAEVEVRPVIAGNILRQPFFKRYRTTAPEALPGAEFIHHNAFYFGNSPDLTPADLDLLCSLLERP